MLKALLPLEHEELYKNTPIKDFYRDKIIFLTGSTGVLGELFVEKLLRCVLHDKYMLSAIYITNEIKKKKKTIISLQMQCKTFILVDAQ